MKKILQFLLLVLTCSIAAHSFGALTSQSLQYDDLNRLTGVDYGNGIAIQYNYDEAGNITLVTAQGNTPPQAVDSTVVTNEDTPVSATLSGSDADNDPLTFSIVTNGTIGSAVITNPVTGAFTYTPNLNKVGTDSFTFRVSDGKQQSNLATVTVTINAVESYVTVPNVAGKTQAQAEAAIASVGLGVGTITMANSSTVPVGAVISQSPAAGTTVLNTTLVNLSISRGPTADTTVYENPSDGTSYGWSVFDSDPAGAKISNVYDDTFGRRVINLSGAGLSNGFLLQNPDGTPWNDTDHRLLTWWMQFAGDFSIQVDVDTTVGHRYLVYDALDYDQLGNSSTVHHGLGQDAKDGKWRVFARHLQTDLSEAQPGATITAVNGILIYGSGRLGEVNLTAGRIIKVPTEQPTIQAGIDMAYDGDVVLVAPGTYTGAGNKNLSLYGKQLLLLGDKGPASTIINCESAGRGFRIRHNETEKTIISGFTVTNGKVDTDPTLTDGGGIHIESAAPLLHNCVFSGNRAAFGGGIFLDYSGMLDMLYCTLSQNTAITSGGGMYAASSYPDMTNCVITQNQAQYGAGLYTDSSIVTLLNTSLSSNGNTATILGGGLMTYKSALTITNCTLSANTAQYGGGFCDSTLSFSSTITGSTFTGNTATLSGGGGYIMSQTGLLSIKQCSFSTNIAQYGAGLYIDSASPGISDTTFSQNGNTTTSSGGGMYIRQSGAPITGCTLTGNKAQYGAGMLVDSSSAAVTNCQFTQNVASTSGGGFYFYASTASAVNSCTVSGNSATSGGGAVFDSSTPTIKNSIFWADTPNEFAYNTAPVVSYSDVQGGFAGTGNINANPLFVGGTNYHLTASSPCINTGTATGAPTTDIDKHARPQGSAYDMGADEYLNPTVVMPIAGFTSNQVFGVFPLPISFSDASTGNITTWSWNFGDGTTSTQQHPAHTYNASGFYTVTLTVSGPAGSNTISKSQYIVVTSDTAPFAKNSTLQLNEDGVGTGTLQATDVEGNGLTFTLVSNGSKGTATIINQATGAFSYTPAASVSGTDTFTFKVNDGIVDSNIATVTVTITAVNDPPVALNGSLTLVEDAPGPGQLHATDSEGDVLTYALVGNGTKGSVSITSAVDGTFVYQPHANATGTDVFTFKANDGVNESNIATVTVNITAAGDAPVAQADTVTMAEDTTAVISVLSNDTDPDGDPLSILSFTQGARGVVTNNGNGTLTYAPNTNYVGSDSFTYTITDGNGGTNTATVTITITNVNDAPVAVADNATTSEDTPVTIAVLANDSDVDGDTLAVASVTIPANGTAAISGTSVVYTPATNYVGTDSFSYTITDGHADTATATVTVTITNVNDAPVATNQSLTTVEETPVSGTLSATDQEGSPFTYSIVANGTKGTAVISNPATGAFSYTPTTDATGIDSFTFKANDGTADSNTATVTITITNVNDAPVAVADSGTTSEDIPVTMAVLANDTDVDGDILAVASVTIPANGTAVISGPSVVYTPAGNYVGTDSFSYTVSDGNGGTATATVTVTVSNTNDAPVATNQSLATAEESPVSGTLSATDQEGNALTYSIVTNGSKGTAVISNPATGAFSYIPTADATGIDTFTFKVNDGTADSNVATVTITITNVNDAPVAVADTATTSEDTPVTIAVLANDSDVDGDTLAVASVTIPANGTAAISGTSVVYTPTANFSGIDTFNYTVSDGNGGMGTATVTVTISNTNDAPVATNQSLATAEESPVSGTLSATDQEGSPLTYSIVANGTKGTAVISNPATGVFSYTPTADATGIDTFTFKANDGTADSNIATVTITITNINDAPVAVADSGTTTEDTPVTIVVLANDSDVDGDTLAVASVTIPANGTAAISGTSVVYTPATNYVGTDTFSYTITDGHAGTATATVTVTVSNTNDAPVATSQSLTTAEDTPVSGTLIATDQEGNPLTYSIVANGTKGTIVISNPATGTFTYTPSADTTGIDTFTFKANDGMADSNIATVTITIINVNDAPVAVADSGTTSEDTPVTIAVLANDSDVDGDTLAVASVTIPANGTAAISGPSVVYTPAGNYVGTDSFNYTVSDGNGGTATATVTVTITNVNDTPTATDQSLTTVEETPVSGALSATDLDGNPLTYSIVANGSKGTAIISNPATGVFSYTPTADATGIDTFTFKANDGTADSNTATVTITITPVNDAPTAVGDTAITTEETPVTIAVLANDTDVDGDTLAVVSVTIPANGTAAISGTSVVYTPTANFSGIDTFSYTITDGHAGTAAATVTVTITNVNDAPVATNQSLTTVEETPVSGTLSATDQEGSPFTYSIVANGTKGTAVISNPATGAFSYTPTADATGIDTFTFKANDGTADSNVATVTITITNVNDAPVAVADTATTSEDTPVTIAVLANDSDVDGDALTVASVTSPGHGSAVISGNSVVYTPTANFSGNDTFSYTVSDGNGATATATVTVTITNTNDAPTAVADSATTSEDTPVTIAVLANDTDADGDVLAVVSVTTPAHGTAVSSSTNVVYTPAANYVGADTFSYTIADGHGGTATAIVTINVVAVNDAPTANNDRINTTQGIAVNGTLTGSDPEGSNLTYSLAATGTKGTAVITNAATGAYTYTPLAQALGTDTFTFKANDGALDSNIATVTVDIKPEWTAYRVSLLMSSEDDDELGVIFRRQDDDNYYRFSMNREYGYRRLVKKVGGVFTLLAEEPNLYVTGQAYQVEITAEGDQLTVKVDGAQVFAVQDNAIPQGRVALYSWHNTGSRFDDLRIEDLVAGRDYLLTDFSSTDLGAWSVLDETDTTGGPSAWSVINGHLTQSTDIYSEPQLASALAKAGTYIIYGLPPTATDLTVNTHQDTPVSGNLTASLPSAGPMTYSIVNNGSLGTAVITNPATGAFTYTPRPGVTGTDTILFRASNGLDSNEARLIVNIAGLCTASTSSANHYTCPENSQEYSDSATCSSACKKCPTGYIWSAASQTCTANPSCSQGTYSATANTCVADSTIGCPTGTSYNAARGRCEVSPTCSSGTYNASADKCETNVSGTCSALAWSQKNFWVAHYRAYSSTAELKYEYVFASEAACLASLYYSNIYDKGCTKLTGTSQIKKQGSDFWFAGTTHVVTPPGTFMTVLPSHIVPGSVGGYVQNYNGEPLYVSDQWPVGKLNTVGRGSLLSQDYQCSLSGTTYQDSASCVNACKSLTQAVPACPTGTTFDGTTDTCYAASTPTCTGGMTYDLTLGKCVVAAACASPGTLDTALDLCKTGLAAVSCTTTPYSVTNWTCSIDGSVYPAEGTCQSSCVSRGQYANNLSLETFEDTPVLGRLLASSPNGGAVTYTLLTQPTKGVIANFNPATGSFGYSPAAGVTGTDTFTYKANDGTVDSNIATVTVTIIPINDAPTATNQSLTTAEDTPVSSTLTATDPDGNPLTYSVVANGSKGTAIITNPATGAFTYTPATNVNGTDSFTFKVNDGTADSSVATVSITITSVNDAPVAINDSATTTTSASVAINVLANDVDGDGDALTVASFGQGGHGSVSSGGNGILFYTSAANYSGSDSFTYTISDGHGGSATATVTVTVTPLLDNGSCTKFNDADSDDDGIPDGVEDANHNGIWDAGETDPCNPDTDGDGMQDGYELGYTLANVGSDTDLTKFTPDEDPSTTTDPLVNIPAIMAIINMLLLD